LKGSCLSSCNGKSLIYTFKLYQLDLILNEWVLFTNNSYYYNAGLSNEYFVVLRDLFRDFPNQVYWKVESNIHLTTFAGDSLTASSSILFYVNFSPFNGMCSISPITGTTNTLFTIYCNNWIDKDGEIISFSYYGKINKYLKISKKKEKIFIFYFFKPNIQMIHFILVLAIVGIVVLRLKYSLVLFMICIKFKFTFKSMIMTWRLQLMK
jgi:hypothetical protein